METAVWHASLRQHRLSRELPDSGGDGTLASNDSCGFRFRPRLCHSGPGPPQASTADRGCPKACEVDLRMAPRSPLFYAVLIGETQLKVWGICPALARIAVT